MEREKLIKLIMKRIYTRRIYAEGLADDILRLFSVSGAKRKVCPVCKKTFEKGWGEFCSQDCWDTDM